MRYVNADHLVARVLRSATRRPEERLAQCFSTGPTGAGRKPGSTRSLGTAATHP
jgi:hypothetical protein